MECCTLKENGFVGYYYSGNIQKEKAIIAVGGASCDDRTSIALAQHLIDAGYNVLVLGFYLWKGLSKDLASIPVDYCEKAVKWLLDKPDIEKIAMTGPSTGGSYTLLCASFIPQITCIIPVVPFDYVMEGTTSKNKRMHCSVYTHHGKDIPYTPSELLDMGMKEWLRRAKNAEGYGLSRFMRYGYDQMKPYLTEKSRIKVENINADILLFASTNDDCWPSDEAVPRIVDKLEECNYSRKVEYHIFEKGSHLLPGGLDKLSIISRTIIKKLISAENKYPRECEEARQTCMKMMIEFIRDWE